MQTRCNVALRKESVDRNGGGLSACARGCRSLSARRAWIEIRQYLRPKNRQKVALRKESVDRNLLGSCRNGVFERVALRKESVDRNMGVGTTRDRRGVALRKESVDRNIFIWRCTKWMLTSLSARRAWIEILTFCSASFAVVGRSPQGERG